MGGCGRSVRRAVTPVSKVASGGQVLPVGGTRPVPVGASPWGPAGGSGKPGHGWACSTTGHGIGTHLEPALQLTFLS